MATPNLGLTTFNTASGSATTFLQFRLAIADASSNMSIIGDYAGGVSASIINLENNAVNNVSANRISGNYFEGTADLMTSYATGGMINLTLDTSVTGATTLNINSIGVVDLKKIDTTGSSVPIVSGDLLAGRYYMFIYSGTEYILMNNPIVEISGSGVMSTSSGSVIRHNVSGITSGSYDKVQVDSYGHVTSASVVSYSSIWMPNAKPASPNTLDDEFDDSSISGSWLLFTPGSSLLVTEDVTGLVLYSGSVYDAISAVYKATSGSVFTVWTKIGVETNAIDDYKSGIILGENMSASPVTGSLVVISLSGESFAMNTQVERWDDYATYSTGIANDSIDTLPVSGTDMYLRARVSGSLLSVDLSNNGVGWFQYVDDQAIGFTPLHVGLFNRAKGTNENRTRFAFFRYVPNTVAHGQIMSGSRIKVYSK